MSQNAKVVAKKPFNVDFMRKRSVYIYADQSKVLIETYLMQSKDGIFEHFISANKVEKIPEDIDRVVCVTGKGRWFSPVDCIVEVRLDDGIETNYTRMKVPFSPGGVVTTLDSVTFSKKVYAMQTDAREQKMESVLTKKDNIDSVFSKMGLTFVRASNERKADESQDKKKMDKKKKEEKREDTKNSEKVIQSKASKPEIPKKPTNIVIDDSSINIGNKFIVNEPWLYTKKDQIPPFEKGCDYIIKYYDNAFSEFMKGSPGKHKPEMMIDVASSADERVFVFDTNSSKITGHITCTSNTPISVARFSDLTFALVRTGGLG